jgi:hypothetical protein
MHTYYKAQISKYKEFYPKNKPEGALDNTLLVWRMVYKHSTFREAHPELPESFKEYMKSVMTEACNIRYEKLFAHSSPFDESDIEAVVEGLVKLAELMTEEIELDKKYYKDSFKKDVDIVRLTAETYLKCLVATLEGHVETITSDEAVKCASKGIFNLYKKLRTMDERYAKLVPGYVSLLSTVFRLSGCIIWFYYLLCYYFLQIETSLSIRCIQCRALVRSLCFQMARASFTTYFRVGHKRHPCR